MRNHRKSEQGQRPAKSLVRGRANGRGHAKSVSNDSIGNQAMQRLLLQAKFNHAAGSAPEVTPDVHSQLNLMRSGGHPLPESVQTFFAPRFGHDFSDVRVHSDAQAAAAAQSLNARAYTLGRDVIFGAGQYAPETGAGRRLLAHELTHVVQQRGHETASLLQRQETKEPEPSVINERIDVRAQFALLRLFKGPPEDAKDARDLLNDVNSGNIKGIFGDDLGIAAKLAAKRGTVRWELVPEGQDAVMLKDDSPDTPVIIFRASAGQKPRLDNALLAVYRAHKVTAASPVTVPSGQPKFTAEGSPIARPADAIVLDTDTNEVDTRGNVLVFEWNAKVKTDTPSPDCFEFGFLQTVTESQVFAEYSPGATDPTTGLCMPFLDRIPIRDGFAANPVWFIAGNSKGIGFNVIGTCPISDPNIPPFTLPPTSEANAVMVDKPGGPFAIRHPGDNTKLLRQITEDLTFNVWLAARLRSAPQNNVASYQFIKNATWVVRRTTDFTHNPSGVGFTFTRNETTVTAFGDGQGNSSPDLAPPRANRSVNMICV